MTEHFDEYVDQFLVTVGPFGAAFSFRRTEPVAPGPGVQPQPREIGVIRMSLQHMKVMTFMLKQQVDNAERELGGTVPVSTVTLNALQIAPEDWDGFWAKT